MWIWITIGIGIIFMLFLWGIIAGANKSDNDKE